MKHAPLSCCVPSFDHSAGKSHNQNTCTMASAGMVSALPGAEVM